MLENGKGSKEIKSLCPGKARNSIHLKLEYLLNSDTTFCCYMVKEGGNTKYHLCKASVQHYCRICN